MTLNGSLISGTAAAGTYDVEVTATNSAGSTTGTLRLEIGDPGPIEQFSASELIASPGQAVVLTWVTTAASVSIEPDVGEVDPSGTIELNPVATTTYTLTADGETHSLTVEVLEADVRLGLTSPGRLRPTNEATEWQGWETASEDWSADRAQLSVGGVEVLHGLATHAASRLVYPLAGHYRWLSAQVGIDDEVSDTSASVEFIVTADGVELWTSGVLFAGDAPAWVELDVSGVDELELSVSDAGDGIDDDHADWLDPVLIVAEPEVVDSGDTAEAEDSGLPTKSDDSGAGPTGGCGCASAPQTPLGLLGMLAALRIARRVRTPAFGGRHAPVPARPGRRHWL